MANGEVTTGKVIALIRALSSTSSATYTVTTALVIGAATTSGVRLDLSDPGALGVRLGDDSGYAKVDCSSLVVSDYVLAGRYIKAGYFEINGTTGYDVLFRETYTTSSTNVHQVTASSGALSGASYSFSNALPAGAIILGVTLRVTTTITGATTFDVGDGTDVDRYGAAIALASGTTTTFASATANPLEWRSANGNVVLTANGSNFTGGVVRICVHYLSGTAPSS